MRFGLLTVLFLALALEASSLEAGQGQGQERVEVVNIDGETYSHGSFYSPNRAAMFSRAHIEPFLSAGSARSKAGRLIKNRVFRGGRRPSNVRRFLIGTHVVTRHMGREEPADPNAVPMDSSDPPPEIQPLPLRFVSWFNYNNNPKHNGRWLYDFMFEGTLLEHWIELENGNKDRTQYLYKMPSQDPTNRYLYIIESVSAKDRWVDTQHAPKPLTTDGLEAPDGLFDFHNTGNNWNYGKCKKYSLKFNPYGRMPTPAIFASLTAKRTTTPGITPLTTGDVAAAEAGTKGLQEIVGKTSDGQEVRVTMMTNGTLAKVVLNENTFQFQKWTDMTPFTPNQLGGVGYDEVFDVPPVLCVDMGYYGGRLNTALQPLIPWPLGIAAGTAPEE